MGNVVVMAVRHRDLDVVAEQNLKTVLYQMHAPDCFPKSFNKAEKSSDHHTEEFRVDNIAVSQYYHASGVAELFVDGDMMISTNVASYSQGVRGEKTLFNFEDCVKFIRRYLRHEKLSLLKSKESRPTKEGDKVSLFLLFTDTLDRVENKPQVMKDVVHYCRTGEVTRTFGSINEGIAVLGTLEAGEAAILMVKDYGGQMQVMPRFELNLSQEERLEIIQKGHSVSRMGNAFLRELAAAHGYTLRKTQSRAKAA